MTGIIKLILRAWLIKYWFIVVLALIIGGTIAGINHSIEKKTKHYSANIHGSTLLMNHHALHYYLYPLNDYLHKGNYKEAAAFLGVKEKEVENIKDLHISSVSGVAEESDVRYEFNLKIQIEKDTLGLYKFQNALINLIKRHVLLIQLKENTELIYLESKKIMENELMRLDSLLEDLKEIGDRELIYKRKAEIQIQLVNLKAVKMKIYDVKLIQDFKYSLVEEEVEITNKLIFWLGMSLFASITLVILLDKEIRSLFL